MADIFVEMEKNGMHLVVHPTTVEAHKRAGWKVVKEGVPLPKSGKEKDAAPPKGETDTDKGSSESDGK